MHLSERTLAIVLLAATSASLGCSSTYVPRPGPRLSVVLENGAPVLVKQGRRYPMGVFGSGLVEAVNGNPQAEDRASSFRSLSIGGFAVGLIGAGAVGASAGLLAYDAANNNTSVSPGIIIGVALGGLAVSLIGSSLSAAAQVHYWDAINIYNDSVEPVWMAPPPGYPPAMGPVPYDPRSRPLPPSFVPPAEPAPPPASPPTAPSAPPPAAPTAAPTASPPI